MATTTSNKAGRRASWGIPGVRRVATLAGLLLVPLWLEIAVANNNDGVVGTYFEAYEKTDDGYYPATLKIFGKNGTLEINIVDHNRRTTIISTYYTQADKIIFTTAHYVNKCSWSPQIVKHPPILSYTQKNGQLTLSLGGDDETLSLATSDQIKMIMSVPVCVGNN